MSDINEKSGFAFTFQPVTKLFEEQVRLHPESVRLLPVRKALRMPN